jgi:N-formylglutamate amidohydrolase
MPASLPSSSVVTHELAGVYSRRDPGEARRVPVLFDIPRSGREYPPSFHADADFVDLHSSVSKHLEMLYGGVTDHGATWLYARFPNAFIDANRHELDIDPTMLDGVWPATLEPSDKSRAGIGLIPLIVRGNRPIYVNPKLPVADVRARIDDYYLPFHAELNRILRDFRGEFGVAYHLSCHSMGSRIPAPSARAGELRSDFDLGDRNGATASSDFTDFVREVLVGFGYDVTQNAHFIGAECVRRHGAPRQGVHSVQIEMRRNLYMDEATGACTAGFEQVRDHMTQLAEKVAAYARDRRADARGTAA